MTLGCVRICIVGCGNIVGGRRREEKEEEEGFCARGFFLFLGFMGGNRGYVPLAFCRCYLGVSFDTKSTYLE